jgi:hypothetical protein
MTCYRQDGGLHRSEFVLCPSARVSSAECPAERTQRSAPPPPCFCPQADGGLGWTPSGDGGQTDPGSFSAHRCASLPTNTQRADTEVRRPWAERVEQRKWRVETRGTFRGADTEIRAVVEQACQPVCESDEGEGGRWLCSAYGDRVNVSRHVTWTDRPGGLSPRWGTQRSALPPCWFCWA